MEDEVERRRGRTGGQDTEVEEEAEESVAVGLKEAGPWDDAGMVGGPREEPRGMVGERTAEAAEAVVVEATAAAAAADSSEAASPDTTPHLLLAGREDGGGAEAGLAAGVTLEAAELRGRMAAAGRATS